MFENKSLCNLFKKTSYTAIFFFILSSAAHAVPITIGFSGKIGTAGSFFDPTGLFTQGDSITGFWTVETTTPDTNSDTDRGLYAQSGSPSFQINIGTYEFQSEFTNIQILDDYVAGIGTLDAYDVLGGTGTSNIFGLDITQMQLTFRDTQTPYDAILNDSLPIDAPDPSLFDQINQSQGQLIGYYNSELLFMNLTIDSVSKASETSVSAPGTIALFFAGLLLLIFARSKQQYKFPENILGA